MSRHRRNMILAVVLASLAMPVIQLAGASVAGAASYTPTTPVLDQVSNGPWTLSQGDPGVGPQYPNSLPTYKPESGLSASNLPNLAVYPGASSPSGTPYASGVVGTPGPVDAYCGSGPAPETGSLVNEPANTAEPMSPYYFPFVTQTPGDSTQGHLTGYFDYRPKDTEEAIAVATSTDGGNTWTFKGKALDENPENYCPTGDSNDNGQGHPFVMTVDGNSYLYTVNRPAGDNLGVGLLVHAVNPAATNPVASLPSVESVGTDPDTFASGSNPVPATGGASISVTTLGSGAETVGAGQFEDLSSPGSLITCSGTGTNSLTGCTTTAPGGLTVGNDDALVQVLGDASAVNIPQGPNTPAETGGVTLVLNAPLSAIANANVPGRFYVDGATIYCVNINGASTALENCTTTQSGGVAVSSGDAVTTDPILPTSVGTGAAYQTNGLVAPDGIVGSIPSSSGIHYAGAPPGSTEIIYGEKILNYYIEGTLTSSVNLSSNPSGDIPLTPSGSPAAPIPASGSFDIYLGTSNSSPIQTVNCTGYTAPDFTGCTGGTGTAAAGNDIGGPGAAIAPYSVLGPIGEGKSKAATLFKNNEDLTELRVASTTDGINFTDLGVISGTSGGAANYSDIDNPSAQGYPSSINLAQGATDDPELRFVGTRGTIIDNGDGTIGMFDSGAWESDGDSDAFDQIFYTQSSDGVHWSEPVVVESTDYTFSGRANQDANAAGGDYTALPTSAYFAGRAYSPTVVQNPDGTLTMVFSGYSTPKPIPVVGNVLGDQQRGAPQWTVSATDPALYRNILTVQLTPSPNSGSTPEAPNVLLLPFVAIVLGGTAVFFARRRRHRAAAG